MKFTIKQKEKNNWGLWFGIYLLTTGPHLDMLHAKAILETAFARVQTTSEAERCGFCGCVNGVRGVGSCTCNCHFGVSDSVSDATGDSLSVSEQWDDYRAPQTQEEWNALHDAQPETYKQAVARVATELGYEA